MRSLDAGEFHACHRMSADEGPMKKVLPGRLNYSALDTADIGDHGTCSDRAGYLGEKPEYHRNRGREENEIGICDGLLELTRSNVDRAPAKGFSQDVRPVNACDHNRPESLLDSEPQRTADNADTNDGDSSEGRIGSGEFLHEPVLRYAMERPIAWAISRTSFIIWEN